MQRAWRPAHGRRAAAVRVQAGLSGHPSLGTWQRIELARRWAVAAGRLPPPGAVRQYLGLPHPLACPMSIGPPTTPRHALPLLCCRKLEVAVQEENYQVAADAKREIQLLTERLPTNQLLLATLLERLERGGLGEEEAAAVVCQLGELGEW